MLLAVPTALIPLVSTVSAVIGQTVPLLSGYQFEFFRISDALIGARWFELTNL